MTATHDMPVRRFTALAGCATVVLYILSAMLSYDAPEIDASPPDILKYAAASGGRLLVVVFVWGGITSAALCFLTGLWSVVRRRDEQDGMDEVLAILGLGAGYVLFAIAQAGFVFILALGYRGTILDATQAKLMNDLIYLGITLSGFPTAVSTAAFAIMVRRTRAVAVWTSWIAAVAVIAHVVSAGSFAQDGMLAPTGVPIYIAPTFYFIWMLTVSILLFRRAPDRVAPAS